MAHQRYQGLKTATWIELWERKGILQLDLNIFLNLILATISFIFLTVIQIKNVREITFLTLLFKSMLWWEWESFGFSQVKKCLIWNFENYKKPVAAIIDAVVACK